MPVRSGYMPVMNALRPDVQLCIGDIVHEDCRLAPDPVDVGRLTDHQAAVVDARLHPADVIAHDEEDVGFLRLLPSRSWRWLPDLRPASTSRLRPAPLSPQAETSR